MPRPMTDPNPRPPAETAAPSERAEWLAAAALAAASIVWWVLVSRETWFFADSWDFLARREIGDLSSWLEPHLGHLQIPTFVLHRVLYGAVGLDYYPWYVVPHATIYALVALLVWRTARWRGASRGVAFAVFVVFSTLGVAEVVYATVIGPLVALAGMAVIAAWMDGARVPARFPRLWLALILTVMVASGSTGTIVALAALIVVVASPGLRTWWPSFVIPGALYVTWWATWAADSRMNDVDLSAPAALPVDAARMLGVALARLFGVPEAGWPAYAALSAAALVVLAVRRRLTPAVRLTIVALGGLLAAILLIRVTDDELLRATRYSFMLATVAIVGFGPAVRLPGGLRRPAAAALVLLVGWMVVFNGAFRVDRIQRRADMTQDARVGVDAVATMAAEPMIGGIRVDRLGDFPYMSVTVGSVVDFVEDGYRPLEVGPEVLAELRPLLRFGVLRRGKASGTPVEFDGVDERGCVTVGAGGSLVGRAQAAGTLQFRPQGPVEAVLSWSGPFGVVERRIEVDEPLRVEFPEPVPGETTVTVSAAGSPLVICGLPAP